MNAKGFERPETAPSIMSRGENPLDAPIGIIVKSPRSGQVCFH